MKKFLAGVAALALTFSLVACSNNTPSEPEGEEETTEGEGEAETALAHYDVYNETGEEVTELYIYDNSGSDKGTNYVDEIGWSHSDPQKITVDLGELSTDISFTLEFVTESGYVGTFETLAVEEAPISLISQDAMTGETMITFEVPNRLANYDIYNVTGEKVTDLYIWDNSQNDKGENLVGDGMDDGAEMNINWGELPVSIHYTLEFTTESGYVGTFEGLAVEQAPISLISQDAMTGETMISFTKPE